MNNRGFTLIELMVVIAIIGVLSSVVMASLNTARTKGLNVSGMQGGKQVLTLLVACDLEGGKVTVPNSTTNPTNDICSLGSGYGTWPKAPQGWTWTQYVWTSGSQNLMHMAATYPGGYGQIHCGYYPDWSSYCGTSHTGLCTGSKTFACTYYDSSTGYWK